MSDMTVQKGLLDRLHPTDSSSLVGVYLLEGVAVALATYILHRAAKIEWAKGALGSGLGVVALQATTGEVVRMRVAAQQVEVEKEPPVVPEDLPPPPASEPSEMPVKIQQQFNELKQWCTVVLQVLSRTQQAIDRARLAAMDVQDEDDVENLQAVLLSVKGILTNEISLGDYDSAVVEGMSETIKQRESQITELLKAVERWKGAAEFYSGGPRSMDERGYPQSPLHREVFVKRQGGPGPSGLRKGHKAE